MTSCNAMLVCGASKYGSLEAFKSVLREINLLTIPFVIFFEKNTKFIATSKISI